MVYSSDCISDKLSATYNFVKAVIIMNANLKSNFLLKL
jgi:hypothetical protein